MLFLLCLNMFAGRHRRKHRRTRRSLHKSKAKSDHRICRCTSICNKILAARTRRTHYSKIDPDLAKGSLTPNSQSMAHSDVRVLVQVPGDIDMDAETTKEYESHDDSQSVSIPLDGRQSDSGSENVHKRETDKSDSDTNPEMSGGEFDYDGDFEFYYEEGVDIPGPTLAEMIEELDEMTAVDAASKLYQIRVYITMLVILLHF
jgi:hypothetical protein